MTRSERKSTECISPGCQRYAKHRGLCSSCYQSAIKVVREGVVTWERLIELGLALACPRNGNRFKIALAAALRGWDTDTEPVAETPKKHGRSVRDDALAAEPPLPATNDRER